MSDTNWALQPEDQGMFPEGEICERALEWLDGHSDAETVVVVELRRRTHRDLAESLIEPLITCMQSIIEDDLHEWHHEDGGPYVIGSTQRASAEYAALLGGIEAFVSKHVSIRQASWIETGRTQTWGRGGQLGSTARGIITISQT